VDLGDGAYTVGRPPAGGDPRLLALLAALDDEPESPEADASPP